MHPAFNFSAYMIYLPVVIVVTWLVAWILFKNSKVFMIDIFHGKQELALATNKLFETGFYLLNIGFAFRIMVIGQDLDTPRELMEVLSTKLGGFFIYLGIMLFLNLYLFFRGRRISKARQIHADTAAGLRPLS
ncbi:hypothetical protein HF324_10240 [Chitinophaga oryzae]|uniref:Uncharacterized protein n=1 Tax=Chitinophaga oryzae TaxID=2725414 RepID=A0AAE6ZFH4_9BACT|nr:hypothetical protein [Chitinophaga oryzae]QJB31736.1 hypothetical protein HF329_10575 [Chitinophaga oryzae]QJB38220.1 hypothetical protein HF324_10240 [Chitinophaga oryzae]